MTNRVNAIKYIYRFREAPSVALMSVPYILGMLDTYKEKNDKLNANPIIRKMTVEQRYPFATKLIAELARRQS